MSVILEAGTAIYVAMAVALSVWIGLFVYLWRIDAQARELRRKLDSQQRVSTSVPTATLRSQKVEARDARQEKPEPQVN